MHERAREHVQLLIYSLDTCDRHTKVRSLELSVSLPSEGQELKAWSQHPLPPRVCISRELELEAELGLKRRLFQCKMWVSQMAS